jgi:transposase
LSAFARRERALHAVAVVGVDAGKFHHVLVVRPRGRPDSKPFRFSTDRTGFEQAVAFIRDQVGAAALGGEILAGIEFAGSYGFTFAHYLHVLNVGFGMVTVLPAHTKRWKEVTHRQPLKTDAKDAIGITDLAAHGHFVALPTAQGAVRDEIPLLIDRLNLYEAQLRTLEARMRLTLRTLPAARALVTIPNVAPVTAAVLLGSIGDPKAYDSSRQVLAVAGLSLVERSSGIMQGLKRISKRGRPALRKHAYMFALRSVHQDGIYRKEYEALLGRNDDKKIPALMAIARKGLKLMFAIAKAERSWTPARPGERRGDVTGAMSGTGAPDESR